MSTYVQTKAGFTHLNIKLGHAQEGVRYVGQDAVRGRRVQIFQHGIWLKLQPIEIRKKKKKFKPNMTKASTQ